MRKPNDDLHSLVYMQKDTSFQSLFRNSQLGLSDLNDPTKKFETDANVAPTETVRVDGKDYDAMQRLGMFYYSKSTDTVGLSEMDRGLFVQASPDKVYSAVGEDAINRALSNGRKLSREEAAQVMLDATRDLMADYRNRVNNNIQHLHPNKPISLLVLGSQKPLPGNAQAYFEQWQFDESRSSANCKCFVVPAGTPGWENETPITIYHLNIESFSNQKIDSDDLEKLTEVYQQTYGAEDPNPITIHCTDCLDRAGGFSAALYFLKHYDEIFIQDEPELTIENIYKAHERLQNIRGGFYCTDHENRLQGAVNLATTLRIIHFSKQLINQLDLTEEKLPQNFRQMPYLQQLYILRENQKGLSPMGRELLSLLVDRADMEAMYFNRFANDKFDPMPHPQAELWQSLQQIEDDFGKGHTVGGFKQKVAINDYKQAIVKLMRGENLAELAISLKNLSEALHNAPTNKKAAVVWQQQQNPDIYKSRLPGLIKGFLDKSSKKEAPDKVDKVNFDMQKK